MFKVPHLLKFTPMSQDHIARAIEDGDDMKEFAFALNDRVQKALAQEKFAPLRALVTSGKMGDLSEHRNTELVIDFLNEVGLMEGLSTGGEGVAIINAYQAAKPKNHDMVRRVQFVDCREELKQEGYLAEHRVIEKGGFHQINFSQRIAKDFAGIVADEERERFYLLQTDGAAGPGDTHFIAVAIRKKSGETEPLIEMFDPSPALVRQGLYRVQEQVAAGLYRPFRVLSSIAEGFKGTQLKVSNNQFFNNSTPFMTAGNHWCGTFSMEAAYEMAAMSREEREGLLRLNYTHQSPCGGWTEIDLNWEDVIARTEADKRIGFKETTKGEKFESAAFGVPLAMTQFKSHYDDAHEKKAKETAHQKKSGETETLDERRGRYLEDVKDLKTGLETQANTLVEEKALRQRLHLFEIITSKSFGEFALQNSRDPKDQSQQALFKTAKDFKRSITGNDGDDALVAQVLPYFKTNGVGRCSDFEFIETNGTKSLKFSAFCGEMRANQIQKLHDAMKERGFDFGSEVRQEDFSGFDMGDVMIEHSLLKRHVAEIHISNINKFLEIAAQITKEKVDLKPVLTMQLATGRDVSYSKAVSSPNGSAMMY